MLLSQTRAALAVAMLCAASVPAVSGVSNASGERPGAPVMLAQNDPDVPEDAQSAAALLVRVDRLENRIRTMTGQIEQLQYQNQRLEDQLRKMQQDVDFRFQDLGRPGAPPATRPLPLKRGDLDAPAGEDAPILPAARAPTGSVAVAGDKPSRRTGDAFDPDTAPDAPGVPRPLGRTAPSEPLSLRAAGTPAPKLPSSRLASGGSAAVDGEAQGPLDITPKTAPSLPATLGQADEASPGSRAAPEGRIEPGTSVVASLAPGGTRTEYDAVVSLYKGAQYDAAATGFTGFLQKYPRDKFAADATYLLGESYARLGRQREAAEQFLKFSTDYTRSSRAPDALLRLGVALNAFGAPKEQVCDTYREVGRKFPSASPDVRTNVEREMKRAKC